MPVARAKSIHNRGYQILLDCLRRARRVRKVTQAQLAAKLGVDQSYISKYERAERRLDLIELRSICRALGIDLCQFVKEFEVALKAKGIP